MPDETPLVKTDRTREMEALDGSYRLNP
jgi:hypothetical protein